MKILNKSILFLLILIGSFSAVKGQITLKIDSMVMCSTGDSITVSVLATNLTNIAAISIHLQYNPAILKCGRVFSWGIDSSTIVYNNISTTGNLIISWVSPNLTNISYGSGGTITLFKMRIKHISGTSAIYFNAVPGENEIADGNGTPYSLNPINGAIIQGLIATSTITPSGPTTFCLGNNVLLAGNTGTGVTYQWQKNGLDIIGETLLKYSATTSGSYTLKVTSECGTATSAATVVTVKNLPVFSLGNDTIVKLKPSYTIPGYSPLTLTAPGGMTTYLWSTGATTQSIAVDTTGLGTNHTGLKTIWVNVTNIFSCDYTDTIKIFFQDNSGINESAKTNFKVYPNPNNGLFIIEVNGAIEYADFKLLDLTGKEILNEKVDFKTALTKEFDLRNLSKGIYFVRLINIDFINTIKVVVQ